MGNRCASEGSLIGGSGRRAPSASGIRPSVEPADNLDSIPISQDELDALPAYETGPFSEGERAALALADAMALTNPGGRLDAALHDRLRPHFDDGELYELGMIMGLLTGMAKFLFVFDLVEKEQSCPFA